MKRLIAVLSGLLVLPAFAEVVPTYYADSIEYNEAVEEDVEDTTIPDTIEKSNMAVQSHKAGRTTSRTATNTNASHQKTTSRIITPSRTASVNSKATTNSGRTTVSRSSRTMNGRTNTSKRSNETQKSVKARLSTKYGSVIPGSYSTSTATSGSTVLTDSGASLYNNTTANIGRRATTRLASAVAVKSVATPTVTTETVTTTTDNLNAVAELTEYCKAQYAACMDNYCNVLDDNQGRCSCSKNIKNYEKTELALESAEEALQNVVQKIKYIGLTGDQIEALFTETEAELQMKETGEDATTLKNDLDKIKKMVVEISTPNASTSATSGISADLSGLLSFDTSSSGLDLGSLLGGSGTNTTSISNQRGEQLYKTATSRCKTAVLNSCTEQGIDANVITNSYDLEIDKQCVAYERSLTDANANMKTTINNATVILQQARLMLAQNKNTYDLRGCISALDSCMQDEYVCGNDYEKCLDPSGKYLVNGEIIIGSTPGISGGTYRGSTSTKQPGLYQTWNYTPESTVTWAWGDGANLSDYVNKQLAAWELHHENSTRSSNDIATFILNKIGYYDDSTGKNIGMCSSILNQCQDYTFTYKKGEKSFVFDNNVLRGYLSNVLTQIKLKQDEILAGYAEDCLSDVTSCLSSNGYDSDQTTFAAPSTYSMNSKNKNSIRACRSQILTCMSVNGYETTDLENVSSSTLENWVGSVTVEEEE